MDSTRTRPTSTSTTVTVSTALRADAETVWRALRSPQTFVHVAGAMARYPAAERRERPFRTGDVLQGWTFLFRVIPFSNHRLEVVEINDQTLTLETVEGGGLVRLWHHTITVTPSPDGTCRYVDGIEIDAGPLTKLVVAYANVFYRYRQRRWRHLARLLADVERSRDGAPPAAGAATAAA